VGDFQVLSNIDAFDFPQVNEYWREQLVYKECRRDPENGRGLSLFTQYGWAAEDRNLAEHYVGAGLVYAGLRFEAAL
jgi:carbohydrate-selective porin OprB